MIAQIQNNINNWPYPLVETMYKKKDYSWVEVNLKTYDDQLGCVPPIRQDEGAFMVGECWDYDYDRKGNIYAAFTELYGRYFCKLDILKNFDPFRYKHQISMQFNYDNE